MSEQFQPTTLSDFICYFLDESWAGVLNKLNVPDIELLTDTFTGSGTGGEVEKILPLLKSMKAKLFFGDINPKVLALVGNPEGRDEPLIFKGSMNRDGLEVPLKITMQGDWFKFSGPEFSAGEAELQNEIEGSLHLYSIEIDGKPSLYIDKINKIYKPDGKTDVWEKIRKNIGKQ